MRRVLFFWFTLTLAAAGITFAFTHRALGGHRFTNVIPPILVVWFGTGMLAHRLARPIGELAEAAKAFGLGDLSKRVNMRRLRGSEAFILGSAFNDMATRIERLLENQRALLTTVSHELRTPLARLRVELELLRDDPGAIHRIADAEREVEEMDALVGDVLAHGRVDGGGVHRSLSPLRDLAVRAVESVRVDPSLLVVDAPEGATATVDVTLVVRALCILLTNGQTHGGGVTEFRVDTTAGHARFVIEDAGPGVEDGEDERIFEPFYDRAKHLGLGLSLVQRIARAHGGRAGFERKPVGSRFWLEVPLGAG
ncbi:MAG: HAMP domain-containing histidine kinase [Proteobacteria bacterium]|nr:MAG: HAMP domain-containing histidine kinase [Pseudomonadota bacterium]